MTVPRFYDEIAAEASMLDLEPASLLLIEALCAIGMSVDQLGLDIVRLRESLETLEVSRRRSVRYRPDDVPL
jgi:hypothetical protein